MIKDILVPSVAIAAIVIMVMIADSAAQTQFPEIDDGSPATENRETDLAGQAYKQVLRKTAAPSPVSQLTSNALPACNPPLGTVCPTLSTCSGSTVNSQSQGVCCAGTCTLPQPQTIALSGPNSILEIGEPLYEEKPAITASDTIALQGGTLSTPLGTSTYA